jgi:hypothetical protein
MRESQLALHQRFEGSAVAQKKRKGLKDFLEEGESKKEAMAQVLAGMQKKKSGK